MTLDVRATWRYAIALLSALLCLSCAKTGMPPGGAEDKTGPSIVAHYPLADAVNVDRKLVATLEFSETVNRSSVETALFLTPEPGNRLKYRWRGRSLDLIYLDSLAANRTYVISVGSTIKDQRGNPAGEPYTIAFSTGDQIDRGRLRGIIADEENPQTVSIWAYDLSSTPDPDPAIEIADYALQADRSGQFTFGYLRLGTYRAFAVHDRNLNRVWDMSSEKIGIPPWDVTITESGESYLSFRLSNQDTNRIKIVRVKEIDARRFEVRFSKHSYDLDGCTVVSESLRRLVGKPNVMTESPDVREVFFDERLDKGRWDASFSFDNDGEPYVLSDSVTIRAKSDTSRPLISCQSPDGKSPARELSQLSLHWSEPVNVSSAFLDSSLLTSSDNDTLVIRFPDHQGTADEMHSIMALHISGDPEFQEGKSYTLTFPGPSIMDMDSNTFSDSTSTISFAFYAADSLGGIRGNVEGVTSSAKITLSKVSDKKFGAATRGEKSEFHFSRLVPGDYIATIRAVRGDVILRNDDGTMYPLQFSDPFIISHDTITVRARWDTEVTIRWDVHP